MYVLDSLLKETRWKKTLPNTRDGKRIIGPAAIINDRRNPQSAEFAEVENSNPVSQETEAHLNVEVMDHAPARHCSSWSTFARRSKRST